MLEGGPSNSPRFLSTLGAQQNWQVAGSLMQSAPRCKPLMSPTCSMAPPPPSSQLRDPSPPSTHSQDACPAGAQRGGLLLRARGITRHRLPSSAEQARARSGGGAESSPRVQPTPIGVSSIARMFCAPLSAQLPSLLHWLFVGPSSLSCSLQTGTEDRASLASGIWLGWERSAPTPEGLQFLPSSFWPGSNRFFFAASQASTEKVAVPKNSNGLCGGEEKAAG